MKKVLAIVIVVVLLMAMAPVALAADVTVNVSVSIDGKLLVAAQPVTTSNATIEGVLIAAHKAFYADGEAGYSAGIDATYNMYLITSCWGASGVPYVIQNKIPVQETVNTALVYEGDNIIICHSSNADVPATPVSLTSVVTDGVATITAELWTLDFTTFTYKSTPVANANVVDSAGKVLGITDEAGVYVVTTPTADGIVAIEGLAAINTATIYVPPVIDYSIFAGPDGQSLLILVICGLALAIPMGLIVLFGQRKELKNRGLKYK